MARPELFKDYCPNGLQLDADRPIHKVITGVTANQALIERAIEEKADAVLVHHGWFWKGESPTLTGLKGRRARALFQHGISLLAYHLPLDAHQNWATTRGLPGRWGGVELDLSSPWQNVVWEIWAGC